ncbi:MAG: SDR family oxidoreductase, partial [Proteobacteria bacterium]|nr:SDR family oxidoreductase [Pseudomonadota bacterium]
RFGIEADAVAGHSYGEVLALHAAGVLSLSSMLELSYWRGHLMATHGQTDGAMLAVMSSAERIQEILKDHDINFEWANFNAPQQVVLGGSAANCLALAKILKKAGIGSRRLEVSTAFHTSYVQAAVAPFQAKLEDHSFAEAKIPVYANSTAAIYPLDPQAKRHNLSQQIGSSVRFSAMLDALAESSIRTVLEIGPQKKLTGLLRANLADRDILTLDAEPGSSLEGLAQLLAQLAALAHHLDLEVWDAGPLPRALDSKKSFTVSISGANYRNPTKEAVPVPLSPLASDTLSPSTLNSIQPEDPMSSSTDWQRLEKIMHDMHDIQRKTADAHTLFLENQRQFQGLLQGLIHTQNPLGSSESASRQDFKSPINSPETQPYKEPAPLPERKPKAADPIKPKLEPDSGRAPSPAYSAKNSLSKPEQSSEKSSAEFDVFEVLARCTGYPAELLKLEMQLEADLGIDSIKKVEIFSQLQSLHSSLEADSSRLGDVQTIADLVALLPKAVLREQPRIGAWAASPVALAAAVPAANHVSVLQIVAEKTGFPVTMLLAEMELEADLGIDSIKKVEIFSAVQEQLPEAAKLGPEALHSVRTLADLLHLAEADDSDFQLDTKALGQHSAVEEEKVWRVIADRTGYPREVLQESMSLEADLGIDSIKRVEIFSALSDELPSLQGAGQERIAELQTVGDLIDLARQAAVAVEKDVTDALLNPDQNSLDWDLSKKKSPAESKDKIEQLFEGTHGESIDQKNSSESRASELSHAMTGDVAEKAFQNFNARQQFEQDLSLQSLQLSQPELVPYISSGPVRQWRRDTQVWIADDGSSMARTLMLKLQERGLHVKLVSLAQVDRLQAPEQLHGLILLAPSKLEVQPIRWLSLAFRLLRKCGPALKAAAGESLFAVVSRYGGHFGVDGLQSIDQVYGSALAALVKTVAQEWDGVHARALDMAADFIDGNEAAQRCLETLLLAGPVEMGVTREQTFELQLKAFPWPQEGGGEPLAHFGELILVTGGARGVTAASLLPLVKQWKPKLVIWGRTALESFEHPSLAGLEDASSLQRALLSLYPDLSRPRDLAAAYQKLMQQREMRDHLAALKAAGAQVVYEVVDVSQDAELRHAFARLYEEHGVPQGILHGAGVIRDKFILDQKDEEFTEVLATKLRLLPHLEEAARRGTRWQILFSSSTARLGRKGQVAYGVANETLNKFAQLSNHLHPRCYVLAFNWGPWAGGMVNDGLKKIFAAEGVATISLDAGSALVYQSLAQPQLALHELMVLGREESLDDPMAKTQKESLICAFDINIKNTPILLDHVIKQRAVVPAALILEYLAAAAQSRFPELSIQEIKDFRVLKGIVLDADQSISVAINLVKEHQDTSSVELEIQMLGLVGGVPSLPHARAIVLFGPRLERSQSSRGSAL